MLKNVKETTKNAREYQISINVNKMSQNIKKFQKMSQNNKNTVFSRK